MADKVYEYQEWLDTYNKTICYAKKKQIGIQQQNKSLLETAKKMVRNIL